MTSDICDRCNAPVVQNDRHEWVHASPADLAACALFYGPLPVVAVDIRDTDDDANEARWPVTP